MMQSYDLFAEKHNLFNKILPLMALLCFLFTIFACGIGEKSSSDDALAYYFALTEKTSEICFGIVRFKKQEGMA